VIGWLAVAGAVVVAAAVLGYCAYQVSWRLRRLQGDVTRLTDLAPEVAALQRRLELLAHRASAGPAEQG
jgi:hypothetical protein